MSFEGQCHGVMLLRLRFTHGEVLVRSSLRVKKMFGIRDQWYTVREHTDAAHNAESSVQMNMASCFELLRQTSFWPDFVKSYITTVRPSILLELKPLVFYHQITYTLH